MSALVNYRFWLVASFGCVTVQVAILALLNNGGAAYRSWSLFPMLGLSILAASQSPRVPGGVAFLVCIAGVLNAIGELCGLFQTIMYYDKLMHTYAGFAVTGLASWRFAGGWATVPVGQRIRRYAALGLCIGLGWEALEVAIIDFDAPDTALDILCDVAGAALAAPFAAWISGRGNALH